jgi:hypothetical protein
MTTSNGTTAPFCSPYSEEDKYQKVFKDTSFTIKLTKLTTATTHSD